MKTEEREVREGKGRIIFVTTVPVPKLENDEVHAKHLVVIVIVDPRTVFTC